MSSTRSSKRPPSNTPVVKQFITTASVIAVLGGWVAFSSQPPAPTANTSQSIETSLSLAPIPTVIPRPFGRQNYIQSDSQPVNSSQSSLPELRSVQIAR
jgi:hypothetical protein